jgi:hypothetical protein
MSKAYDRVGNGQPAKGNKIVTMVLLMILIALVIL